MLEILSRRALIACAALAFAAGCSSNSASLASGQSSALIPSSDHVWSEMRILPGPVVAGPIVVPLVPRPINAPRGWPAKKKKHPILFVADGSEVAMHDPKTANGSPEGSITTAVNAPTGLAVDKRARSMLPILATARSLCILQAKARRA